MKIQRTTTNATVLAVLAVSSGWLQAQQTPTRSVWDGVYTADQANRGKAQYIAHCGTCHGDTLNGNEMAPALNGSSFLSNWSGLSVGDLAERIRVTMPADDPGSLSRSALADILAFLFMTNQFPEGTVELPGDTQILQQIGIAATKPAPK